MVWGVDEPGVVSTLLVSHLTAATIGVGLAGYAIRSHWSKLSGRLFAALVLSFVVWTLGSLLRTFTLDPEMYVAVTAAKYVGVATAPVWFFLFAVVYAGGRQLVTRWRMAGLMVLPILTIITVATTLEHQLFYRSIHPVTIQGLTILETTRGPASWAFIVFGYGLLALGSLLLLSGIRRRASIYRIHSLFIILGIALPWAASIAYVVRDLPHPAIDPTPVAFIAGTTLFAVGIFSTRLVDLVPAARSRVFEAIDDAVIVVDTDERVVDVNPTAQVLFDDTTPIGKPLVDVIPPELGKLAPPVDGQGEVREITREDGTRYFRRRDLPLGSDGQYGSVVVLSDVTARENVRTQLQERQQMLERQNDRLEEFTSVVSHDLRNPLSVAAGNLDLAREECDSERLDDVKRAHDRIETLIENLLTLARQGQAVGGTESVSLEKVAEEAWRDVTTDGARLVIEEAGSVEADPDRLRELLTNLFRNAIEHGTADRPADEVVTTSGESADHVRDGPAPAVDEKPAVTIHVGMRGGGFFVEDDGPGIPPAHRDEVFDHGFSTSDSGTGFGLSIVKSIAEAHGWTVSATSSRDGGARFEFTTVGAFPGQAVDES